MYHGTRIDTISVECLQQILLFIFQQNQWRSLLNRFTNVVRNVLNASILRCTNNVLQHNIKMLSTNIIIYTVIYLTCV